MLRPLLNSLKEANVRVERRKQLRGIADFKFESHRDICPICDGKSFQIIKGPNHDCDEGFKLAQIASRAHRAVAGK